MYIWSYLVLIRNSVLFVNASKYPDTKTGIRCSPNYYVLIHYCVLSYHSHDGAVTFNSPASPLPIELVATTENV